MMGHRQGEQVALFYEFSLERQIPGDRLLRSIDRFVELDVLRRELAGFYSGVGRSFLILAGVPERNLNADRYWRRPRRNSYLLDIPE